MSNFECQLCGLFRDERHNVNCAIKWDIACPFGCNTSGFSAEDLQKHRVENFPFHLDITFARIHELGLDDILKVERAATDKSYFETQVSNDFKLELDHVRSTFEKSSYLQKKISLKRKERKEQMRLLEKAIEESSLTSFNGILTWIIPEELREDMAFNSPIFYTGKYGYKLRLQFTKVDNKRQINLIFLKGMYDAILPETFQTKISIKYKFVSSEKKEISPISMSLQRIKNLGQNENVKFITEIDWNPLEMVRFKIDCSEFDISSID